MPPILQVDLQQILSQAVTFVLLVVVLKRVAWKPVLALLDARRAQIEGDLRKAAEAREKMIALQEDYAQRLAKIDEEARAKIQQSIQDGRRIASEIQDEARAQAQAILAKSKETIELELAKAKVTLRDDLTDMTIEAVEDLLRQKLNPQTDKALVSRILDELTESDKA